jgi:hypothetical protein
MTPGNNNKAGGVGQQADGHWKLFGMTTKKWKHSLLTLRQAYTMP